MPATPILRVDLRDAKMHTSASPSPSSPADKWDSGFVPEPVVYGSVAYCSDPESHAGSSDYADDSDNDIEMHTPLTSHASDEEVDQDIVILAGRDGVGFQCSQIDIYFRSTILFDMIKTHGQQARISLPLPQKEVRMLADTMAFSNMYTGDFWRPYPLPDLVRAIELYGFYDCYKWDANGLQRSIIDRLTDIESREDLVDPRFCLDEPRFARRLRGLAEYHGMSRLVQLIDERVPAHIIGAAYGDGDGDRPRKWRKISENRAAEVVLG